MSLSLSLCIYIYAYPHTYIKGVRYVIWAIQGRASEARWHFIKLFTLLDLCATSLRRGHANLLCIIVPSLTDDHRRES